MALTPACPDQTLQAYLYVEWVFWNTCASFSARLQFHFIEPNAQDRMQRVSLSGNYVCTLVKHQQDTEHKEYKVCQMFFTMCPYSWTSVVLILGLSIPLRPVLARLVLLVVHLSAFLRLIRIRFPLLVAYGADRLWTLFIWALSYKWAGKRHLELNDVGRCTKGLVLLLWYSMLTRVNSLLSLEGSWPRKWLLRTSIDQIRWYCCCTVWFRCLSGPIFKIDLLPL